MSMETVARTPVIRRGERFGVAHFVDDAELVGDGELSVDGGADGLVVVGDGESEGFAI